MSQDPRQLSRHLLACAPGDLDAVLAIVEAHHAKLNPADCALALKSLTNRPPPPPPGAAKPPRRIPVALGEDKRFERLLQRIQDLAPGLAPGEMTRIVRTLPRLVAMGGGGGGSSGGESNNAQPAQTYSKMSQQLSSLVGVLRPRMAATLPGYTAQELALTVNALSKLPPPSSRDKGSSTSEKGFEVLCLEAVASKLDDCTPQGLALLLTGLPKLFEHAAAGGNGNSYRIHEYLDGPFLLRFRDVVGQQLLSTAFLPQDLALILNGFTNLGFHPGVEFMHILSQQVQAVLPRCKPQDIALLWNSYTKLGWRPPSECMGAMRDRAFATMATYRPQDWTNILQAMGKMHYDPGALFLEKAVEKMEPALGRFNPQSLACILNAFALLDYVPPLRFRQRLLNCVWESLGKFKTEELCILLHSFGQLPPLAVAGDEGGEGDNSMALVLAGAVERRMDALSPTNLSMVLRALARIGLHPPAGFMRKAEVHLEPAIASLTGLEAALTLHALARLSMRRGLDREEEDGEEEGDLHGTCSSVVLALYQHTVEQRQDLGAQEVSLVMNSMVRLGWPGAAVVDGLCGQMEAILGGAEQRVKDRAARRKAAPSGRRARALFELDDEEEEEEEEDENTSLSSQGLALLLGSFGYLAYVPSRRLQSLLIPLLERRLQEGSFTAFDYSMSLRGLANLPFSATVGSNSFVTTMTQHLIEGLEKEEATVLELGPQDVAMVVNSFAKMQVRADEQLLDYLADALLDCLPQSQGQALASVINAFARLRYHPGQIFLAAFEVEVRRRLQTLDLSTLGLILWSLVVMDSSSASSSSSIEGLPAAPPLSAALLEEAIAVRLLPEIKAQLKYMELAEQGGGANASSKPGGKKTTLPPPSLCSSTRLGSQALETVLCQILQVLLYTASEAASPPLRDVAGTSDLRTLVKRAWRRVAPLREKPVPSALHQEVMAVLEGEGVGFAAEQEDSDGVFSLDIVLVPSSKQSSSKKKAVLPVVMEVDGPTHYFMNEPTMLTGDTVFKRRMLMEPAKQQLRWGAVLSLTLWEWQEAGPRQQDKVALVRRKLAAEGMRLEDYYVLERREEEEEAATAAVAAAPRKRAAAPKKKAEEVE